MRIVPATVLVAFSFGISAASQAQTPDSSAFVVHPVSTELQRMYLSRSAEEGARVHAFVAMNGNSVFGEKGLIDPAGLPVDEIRKALAPYADRRNVVAMEMCIGNERDGTLKLPSRAAHEVLDLTVEGLGYRAGFRSAYLRFSNGVRLEDKLAQMKAKATGQADDNEVPSGDTLVKVYPVQTNLSLYLTDNADCVVEVLPNIELEGEKLLSPEMRASIVKHVAAIKLRGTQKILFTIKVRADNNQRQRLDDFVEHEAPELAHSLLFKTSSVRSQFFSKK